MAATWQLAPNKMSSIAPLKLSGTAAGSAAVAAAAPAAARVGAAPVDASEAAGGTAPVWLFYRQNDPPRRPRSVAGGSDVSGATWAVVGGAAAVTGAASRFGTTN